MICLLPALSAGAQNIRYVDLGLSVLWADVNSGISEERPAGEYLTWTAAMEKYGHDNSGSRLATKSEWDELRDLCSWKWSDAGGQEGYLVTSKVKGFTERSIFLPAAGWLQDGRLEMVSSYASYWTATEGVQPGRTAAYGFNFQRGTFEWHSENRFSEQSVRLVKPLSGNGISSLSLDRRKLSMRQGTSDRLKVMMSHGRRNVNSACSWTSSDDRIACVSPDGLIAARNPGTCIITASAYGKSVECRVTVVADEYRYVDLGLSVLWADRNLGARDSSDYGDYFAWGEIEPKEFFSWTNYRYCSFPGQYNGLDKYVAEGMSHQFLPSDNLDRLLPEDDAATVLLGNDWHIPTRSEFEELEENCIISDTVTAQGIPGSVFTSCVPGYEGHSIFIPFGGRYSGDDPIGAGQEFQLWGSSSAGYIRAYKLSDKMKAILSAGMYTPSMERYYGLNIRPVRSLTEDRFSYLELDGSLTGMSYGESRQVSLVMQPSGRPMNMDNVIWTLSDETVVQVTSGGLVVALKTGSCTLTAEYAGRSISVPVTVTFPSPEPVDLGLSVKWASANLGAASPDGAGGMFAWGETSVKRLPYNWENYKHYSNGAYLKYNFGQEYSEDQVVDFKEQLDPEDDAAHVLLGGNWRMPTAVEVHELETNCTWTYINEENRTGWLVTSNVPGFEENGIFLPETELVSSNEWRGGKEFSYWTSTLEVAMGHTNSKVVGMPIRPVQELTERETEHRKTEITGRNSAKSVQSVSHEYVDLGLSVKWATTNIGASAPEESGSKFTWGETAEKPYYTEYNYSLASYNDSCGCWSTDTVAEIETLPANMDAASANWGGDWRIPTRYEFRELLEKCEWTDTVVNGIRGNLVISKVPGYEGNSIFLPFTSSDDARYMSASSSILNWFTDRCVILEFDGYEHGTTDEFQDDKSFDCGIGNMSRIHITPGMPFKEMAIRPVR